MIRRQTAVFRKRNKTNKLERVEQALKLTWKRLPRTITNYASLGKVFWLTMFLNLNVRTL